MAALITETSDPSLWESLRDAFLYEAKSPSHVCVGKALYKVVWMADGSMAFSLIETLNYLDSRSLKKSKKASYSKLRD